MKTASCPNSRSSTTLRALAATCCALASSVLAGCAHRTDAPATLPWVASTQAVVVITPDWNANHGELRTFERNGGHWREVGSPRPVSVGRNGSAWGLGLHSDSLQGPAKREGDGRSPAGVFAIGTAFGYADGADTALPYTAMQSSSYCIDVSGSPLYNRIVDADVVGKAAVAGSTEPMRRDVHVDGDQRYRQGFVIEHNLQARPDAGSCIFAHLWKAPGEATAGCTAMDDPGMASLLQWLRPERRPLFVLMPASEYRTLHALWGLPSVE